MKKYSVFLGLFLLLPAYSQAEITPQADSLNWLRKISAASHQLNYSGVFVYQNSGRIETSRITHMADESGEHEKLETLDGSLREVIRNNEQVYCYIPEKNTVVIERRRSIKPFPALFPRQMSDLTDNYAIRKGGTERVAGFDSQVLILEPKDGYRYTRTLWADASTGLLLKTNVRNEKNEIVHQFAFTQLVIGGKIDKQIFDAQRLPKAKTVDASVPEDKDVAGQGQYGWEFTRIPQGFRKIRELMRPMPGRKQPVLHIVFSDGLAAVSVFIEPQGKAPVEEGLVPEGSMNVYTRVASGHKITVLGEVPAVTVTQIANSVVFHGRGSHGGKD